MRRLSIHLATPAAPGARNGNRITALRWARLLRRLGHRVRVAVDELPGNCDLLIAVHARKSSDLVMRVQRARPELPVALALAGTDIYSALDGEVTAALEAAWRLVALQPLARQAIPPHCRDKLRVIYQSASAPPATVEKNRDRFGVCVLGHLRAVKDPFLAARATQLLPAGSRLRVLHVGAALDPGSDHEARRYESPRYHWLGELPRRRALETLAACRLLVLTSRAEGGANVVSEAIRCGVPVLSTRIPGSQGLLGDDYPGFFPVGDAAALAGLLDRAESDPQFLAELQRCCAARSDLFAPRREAQSWADLLAELPPPARRPRLRLVERASLGHDAFEFGRAVATGLGQATKSLPWRYFYDAAGSRLFEQICAQPEYYLPAAEREILTQHAGEMIGAPASALSLLELGSGSAGKTALVIEALAKRQGRTCYAPLDVSKAALLTGAYTLLTDFPSLEVVAVHGSYDDAIADLFAATEAPRLVLLIGSNLGNFDREGAARFLRGVATHMQSADRLLLGLDLRKDLAVLTAAYNDAAGVTAQFNLNLLTRINHELGGDFDLTAFEHRARWDVRRGCMELHLVSRRAHSVRILRPATRIDFTAGEAIHTEDSYKYSKEEIVTLAREAGMRIVGQWYDRRQWFSETLLEVVRQTSHRRAARS